ncbi:hypothetical protein Csa_014655 [Cucumis sativus]|uniref:Uncharacterized protein n=1 Tax=Cucumis sativus TaxID=3659 RepID=A0A0A0KZ49_CUCSA|nr:hypothetical protein Csa_014655 [Cucumis sativus]
MGSIKVLHILVALLLIALILASNVSCSRKLLDVAQAPSYGPAMLIQPADAPFDGNYSYGPTMKPAAAAAS